MDIIHKSTLYHIEKNKTWSVLIRKHIRIWRVHQKWTKYYSFGFILKACMPYSALGRFAIMQTRVLKLRTINIEKVFLQLLQDTLVLFIPLSLSSQYKNKIKQSCILSREPKFHWKHYLRVKQKMQVGQFL